MWVVYRSHLPVTRDSQTSRSLFTLWRPQNNASMREGQDSFETLKTTWTVDCHRYCAQQLAATEKIAYSIGPCLLLEAGFVRCGPAADKRRRTALSMLQTDLGVEQAAIDLMRLAKRSWK